MVLDVDVPAPVRPPEVSGDRLVEEVARLRRVVDLHELRPVYALQGRAHREGFCRDRVGGVGPHPNNEEQVVRDRDRGQQGVYPRMAQADVPLDPRSPAVRQECAQFVDLAAQPVDLLPDGQRPDAERDRSPPVHGV